MILATGTGINASKEFRSKLYNVSFESKSKNHISPHAKPFVLFRQSELFCLGNFIETKNFKSVNYSLLVAWPTDLDFVQFSSFFITHLAPMVRVAFSP